MPLKVLLAASLVVFHVVVLSMVIPAVALAVSRMALLVTIRLLKPGLQLSSILLVLVLFLVVFLNLSPTNARAQLFLFSTLLSSGSHQ
jgi:hypothetical protein